MYINKILSTNLTDFSSPIFIEWIFELKKYTQLEQIESTNTINPNVMQQVLIVFANWEAQPTA